MSDPRPCTAADHRVPVCTFLRCTAPPIKKLQQSTGGRPWYGCGQHWQAQNAALLVGMSGSQSGGSWIDVTDLPRASRRQGLEGGASATAETSGSVV